MLRIHQVLLILTVAVLALHCEKDQAVDSGRSSNSSDNSDGGDSDSSPNSDSAVDLDTLPPTTNCGDGLLTDDEACDDGNQQDGDGCAANCRTVKEGWSCNPPGQPCHPVALCGDGVIIQPEQCDDGNTSRDDGCNDLCMVEVGFKCDAASPSTCTPTVCGDNLLEGAETCDDGNSLPADGCDVNCQLEPVCNGTAGCTSSCGDGLIIDEQCDDGNNTNNDGCSAECKTESGYKCEQPDVATGMIEVPIIYKDFSSSHVDFERSMTGCEGIAAGMLQEQLDENGKPVFAKEVTEGYAGASETDTDNTLKKACGYSDAFDDWYDHSDEKSIEISTLKLYATGTGDFSNRWGDDGEQWQLWLWGDWCCLEENDGEWCNLENASNCNNCADIYSDACRGSAGSYCCASIEKFDGDPFFFPLDGLGTTPTSEYSTAGTAPPYANWEEESISTPNAGLTIPDGYSLSHNFHFTSEVRFWFQYDASKKQVLKFLGDDDVWVFINGQMVVDLGGIHVPLESSVAIDDLGLEDGKVYEIALFQAERQTNGSSYKLTLSGFSTSRSECRPDCGDGVIGLGEECDDGVNDGGYGECGENCKMDEYCGDGIVQKEYEACDDGNTLNDSTCPSSCRRIVAE